MLSDTPSCSDTHHLTNTPGTVGSTLFAGNQDSVEPLLPQGRGPRSSRLCEMEPLGCILSGTGVCGAMLGTPMAWPRRWGWRCSLAPHLAPVGMAPSPPQVCFSEAVPGQNPQHSWALDVPPFFLSAAPHGPVLEGQGPLSVLLLMAGPGAAGAHFVQYC